MREIICSLCPITESLLLSATFSFKARTGTKFALNSYSFFLYNFTIMSLLNGSIKVNKVINKVLKIYKIDVLRLKGS